jgi:hypothetical protein
MKHTYELRRFNDDDSITTVLKLEAEPKYAKERAKDYANRHPGLYSLQKIDTIAMYFTEKELDKND